MKPPRPLLLLLLALAGLALSRPAAAQEGDALRFFQQNPGSARMLFRQAPARPVATPAPRPRVRAAPEEATVRRRAAPSFEAPPPLPQSEAPVVAPQSFIHVVGDSLADSLANGLKEHLAVERPEIAVLRKGKPSSGLVRDDYHNWPAVLREMLAGQEKFDLVVMMVGSNDRQQLRDEAGAHDFKSDRWRELYVRRVDDVIQAAREKGAPLLWVGMPVMESQRLSVDMLYLNEIYKERTSRAGVPYVDVWEAFVSDQNQYAASGPDVSGQIVRLRTSDGIHFTRAGALKLGFFTSRDATRAISGGPSGGAAVAALPQDLSDQIRRDTPGLAPQILQGALPLPDELPNLPVIRERPLQGPVIELTGLPTTPRAELLARRLFAPGNEMSIMVEQVLAYGRQPAPKPGRADDHRWPGDRPLN
jgi:uncharacterized protein